MSDQVKILRLENRDEAQHAFCCMAEVPTPWPEAVGVCRAWVADNLGRYVEGFHAQEADGTVVGQIYYAPSERALIPYQVEPEVAVIYCEWVQRRRQKRGVGQRLYSTFEAQMDAQGFKGILVEGTEREERMHYRHYLSRGFQVVQELGQRKLLYRPLGQSEVSVRPLETRIEPRRGVPVEILILSGYLCPFEMSTQVLLQEIVREFGDRVVVREEPLTPATLQRYGASEGIFINGRRKLAGGASEQAIRAAIIEEFAHAS